MFVRFDVSQLPELEQIRLLIHLKSEFEKRKLQVLEKSPEEFFNLLLPRTVAFLGEAKVEKVQQMLALSRKELLRNAKSGSAVVDDLDQFLDAFGWSLSK